MLLVGLIEGLYGQWKQNGEDVISYNDYMLTMNGNKQIVNHWVGFHELLITIKQGGLLAHELLAHELFITIKQGGKKLVGGWSGNGGAT